MKKLIVLILVAALVLFGASFALQGAAAKKAQEEKAKEEKAEKVQKRQFVVE